MNLVRLLGRCGLSLLFALGAALCAAQAASPTAPAVAAFFENSGITGAAISPNGRLVALRVANKDGRYMLAVLDLETMKVTPVAAVAENDVNAFRWVNERRLVFDLVDLTAAQGDLRYGPGLFAVNRDGSDLRQLVERRWRRVKSGEDERMLQPNTFLLDGSGQRDSNDVYVVAYEGYGKSVDTYTRLLRLNTVNGRSEEVDTPLHTSRWLFDQNGVPRIAVTHIGKLRAVHYNDTATGWRKLDEFEDLGSQGYEPVFFAPDQTLYVRSNQGKDKAALYRYDLKNNKVEPQPVVASNDFDVNAGVIYNQDALLGVHYPIDGEITQWFDPHMAAVQKEVDALLPVTTNLLGVGLRAETPYVLVTAFSDQQPRIYYAYNTATKKLTRIGGQHPAIDPKQMAQKDFVRFAARDGLPIPAYITMPPGVAKKNLPMVVLVHGGPNLRGGYWQWNAESQFLASRGYVVLEPEFRGSTGFGVRHFKAGWKQWGLAMQNDVADAARWAIAQGIADPKRICIGGASYGGYATLMGLVNDPDLFRCGFEWVGVTDINLMYSVGWSDIGNLAKEYGMPLLIGDQVKDAAQFKATSPLEQAARIKQPLLLAYGGVDERVPLVHGTKFFDAVRAGNAQVEWVVYPEEGHGWALPKTNIDFWTRVEHFLDRNIGQP